MRIIFSSLLLFLTSFVSGNFPYNKELLFYKLELIKNEALTKYINEFPFENYEICFVDGLGYFYVDNQLDNIKSHLKKGIYWEGGIGALVKKYTLPETIAVDLGSHIGIHTITMSRCVGPRGLVVSFEPQKKIYREQFYNLKLNSCLENVLALPYCVGETCKTVEIVPWEGKGVNEGGAHIGHGGQSVPMIPLDRLNLKNVSCIKMDVESYELNVLKGAYRTIKKCKPVIIFEILGNHDLDNCSGAIKRQLDETIHFLVDIGYQVTRVANTNDFVAEPL